MATATLIAPTSTIAPTAKACGLSPAARFILADALDNVLADDVLGLSHYLLGASNLTNCHPELTTADVLAALHEIMGCVGLE